MKHLPSLAMALSMFTACNMSAADKEPSPFRSDTDSSVGANPGTNPPLSAVCVPVALADASRPVAVKWTAVKGGDTPVEGTLSGVAEVKIATEGTLDGAKVNLTFYPHTIDSGVGLRDSRLKNLFFKIADFPVASFAGVVSAPGGLPTAVGSTQEISIAGVLSLAGQQQDVTAYAQVKVESETSIHIVDNPQVTTNVNARADDSLAANLQALMSAANVASIDDNIKLSGDLPVVEDCAGGGS